MDIGKEHHHAVVIDENGRLLSRRVANDEPALRDLLTEVRLLAEEVVWAVDLTSTEAALVLALLAEQGQSVLYVPGVAVNRAASGYRGQGKTDAKDAFIIADQARLRRDLQPVRIENELVVELRVLTTRRADLMADRIRIVNRLRSRLLGIFPALERSLALTSRGPLVLLTGFQQPAALRQVGQAGLQIWLSERKVRNAAQLAAKACQAAAGQHVVLPGEDVTGRVVASLAQDLLDLDGQIAELDKLIDDRFHRHPDAQVVMSMPGIGVLLVRQSEVVMNQHVAMA